MPEQFHNYINGEWVPAFSGGRTFTSINPANKEDVIGAFAASDREDAKRAIQAAHAALPSWRAMSAPMRGQYLWRAADVLQSRAEEVARAMVRENGKTITEARGEVMRGILLLRYYGTEGLHSVGEVIPSVKPGSLLFTTRQPLGVVSIITPWNFPIAIPLWKIAPALAFGNTVVFKPASLTPHCGVLVAQIFAEAGLPPGVLNLVTGGGSEMGEELVKNPFVRGVSFTGSNVVGREIAAWAANVNVKYQLEMGGKNCTITLPEADLEQAVELTVRGAFGYAGQKCTATSRAIVVGDIVEEFTERVVARAQSLKVGDPNEEDTFVPPVISQAQRDRIMENIQMGKMEGAKLLCGGQVLKGSPYDEGFYVPPTVFTNVRADMVLACEEIFGPVLAIMPARDLDEAIQLANDCRYGLSASLFTRSVNDVLTYIDRIDVGVVKINGETAGVEPQAPFGGMKDSSSHSREQGRAAMEFFTELKTVCVDRAGS